MLSLFDQAFAIVVDIEKGLSLDPNDSGNWRDGKLVGTKYGIAAKYHPTVDVPNLTLDGAKLIYLQEYWDPAGCDLLPPRAAVCMLDAAINDGVKTAVLLMQKACGIAYDGVLGPQSKDVWPTVKDEHIAQFMALRALFYVNSRNFVRDGSSWIRRLFTVSLAPIE